MQRESQPIRTQLPPFLSLPPSPLYLCQAGAGLQGPEESIAASATCQNPACNSLSIKIVNIASGPVVSASPSLAPLQGVGPLWLADSTACLATGACAWRPAPVQSGT